MPSLAAAFAPDAIRLTAPLPHGVSRRLARTTMPNPPPGCPTAAGLVADERRGRTPGQTRSFGTPPCRDFRIQMPWRPLP